MDARKPDWPRARLRDGAELAYRIHSGGNASRRVVLIHALAMDGTFWDPVTKLLSDAAEVLVYDCRGHGASDAPDEPYSTASFADDLRDLLDEVEWPSAVVAGASMGGCVSLAFAGRHPDRVDGLGLIDTTAWYGETAPADWEARATKARDEGLEALTKFQVERWFSPAFLEARPDEVERMLTIFRNTDPAAYIRTCRMLGTADERAILANITAPTAIVVGEHDYATPVAMAEKLATAIRGGNLTILNDARHFTPVERPEDVATAIRGVLPDAR